MATAERSAATDREHAVAGSRSSHPARDRLYEQASGVTHGISEMGGLASAAAQEQLGQIGDTASAYYGQGRDRLYQVERSVEQYIREQPLTCLLIAAGVGAIAGGVGMLLGRAWMRR